MAGNHSYTTNFNIEILIGTLGMKRLLNTSIFKKKGYFILSPSVQNTASWFDLRKVNLDKYDNRSEKGYLLIRLRSIFLLADLHSFSSTMISEDTSAVSANSGVHWRFAVSQDNKSNYSIINFFNKRAFNLQEITTKDLIAVFN